GSHQNLGQLLSATRPQEAERDLREALRLVQQLADDFPALPDYRNQLAHLHFSLASLLSDSKRLSEAEPNLRRARALFQKLATDFPTAAVYRSNLAETQRYLGHLLEQTQR